MNTTHKKNLKMLVVFDDMMTNILSNKKLGPVFITHSDFAVAKMLE